jgi:glc operon protein GlcG
LIAKFSISVEEASALVAAAGRAAADRGLKISVAVCDEGGHLLSFVRWDGASPATARIAIAKTSSAALTRRDTRHFQALINERNHAFVTMPLDALVEGGIAIIVNGQCVGAIGVSGASSTEDAELAKVAAAEVWPDIE